MRAGRALGVAVWSTGGIGSNAIRAVARRPDLDLVGVAFGTIPAGTCGAVRTVATGVGAGRDAIVVEHVIPMARDVAPDWPSSDHDATAPGRAP
jgi:hypothetical protein